MIIIYSQQPLVYSTYIKFENNKSYKDSLRFLLAATIVGAASGVGTAFIIVGFQSNSCDIVVGVVSGVVGCGISGDGGGDGVRVVVWQRNEKVIELLLLKSLRRQFQRRHKYVNAIYELCIPTAPQQNSIMFPYSTSTSYP